MSSTERSRNTTITTQSAKERLAPFVTTGEGNFLKTPTKKSICRAIATDIAHATTGDNSVSPGLQLFGRSVSAINNGNIATPIKDDLLLKVSASFVHPSNEMNSLDHHRNTMTTEPNTTTTEPNPVNTSQTNHNHQPNQLSVLPCENQLPSTNSRTNNRTNNHECTQQYPTLAAALHELGPDFVASRGDYTKRKTTTCKPRKCRNESCSAKADILCVDNTTSVTLILKGRHCHAAGTWLEFVMDDERSGVPPLIKQHMDDMMSGMKSVGMTPNEACREVISSFLTDPVSGVLFTNGEKRKRMTSKITNYWKKQHAANKKTTTTQTTTITFASDLEKVREKHSLRLPSTWIPRPVSQEEHLREIALQLEKEHHLTGLKHKEGCPEMDMILLPIPKPDYSDPLWMKVKNLAPAAFKKDGIPATENILVFSSLTLMRTMVDVVNAGYNVVASTDGTHGLLCNDYYLLEFGIVNPEWRQQVIVLRILSLSNHCYSELDLPRERLFYC